MARKYRKWTQEEWKQFVEIWQAAESVQEVADVLDLSKQHVQNRASNIRKQGVPLKRMNPPKKTIDYKALIELANSLAEKEGNDG